MKGKTLWVMAVIFGVSIVVLIACGGGGGGGSTPLSPPAFNNLAATRWNTTDTVGANPCGVGIGVQDIWVLHVLAQSGNTISFYDERDSPANATNGTMSGYNITYSGPRHAVLGCIDMSASYSVTLNGAGTTFSGTATITCNDAPACSVATRVTGTKI